MSKNFRVSVNTLSKSKSRGSKKRSYEENVIKAIRQQIKEMINNGLITKEFAEENRDSIIALTLEKLKQ